MTAKNKGHIYIIDDDLEMRNSLSRSLGFIGYDVHTFVDPKDFLTTDKKYSPAVIVLDMRMKNTSGLDFQKMLLEQKNTTPVVFISGESDKNEIIQAMKNGASDFLLKPFDLNALEQSINHALQKCERLNAELQLRDQHIQKYNSLTPREKEVCLHLIDGYKLKEISQRLGVTIATLKIHKARVMRKMETTSTPILLRMIDSIKHHI